MFRQIEWREENGSITKNGVLPVTTSAFWRFASIQEPLLQSWFNMPTTQMSIFILFVSTGVLISVLGVFPVSILKSLINQIPILDILKMCYRYTAIQFVCGWSTGRKEIIDKFEKKIETLIFLFQFYTWIHQFSSYIFK